MQSFLQLKYLWGLLIFALCSIPGPQIPEIPIIPHLDKLIHAYLYGQWMWFWRAGQKQQDRWFWMSRLSGLMLFGLAMELWQHYCIPFRTCEVADLLANASGCVLVSLFIKSFRKA